jgi:hypothetical protein
MTFTVRYHLCYCTMRDVLSDLTRIPSTSRDSWIWVSTHIGRALHYGHDGKHDAFGTMGFIRIYTIPHRQNTPGLRIAWNFPGPRASGIAYIFGVVRRLERRVPWSGMYSMHPSFLKFLVAFNIRSQFTLLEDGGGSRSAECQPSV